MEIKKSSKANLEKDISLNYLMGVVIALAILFVGFEMGEQEITVATDFGPSITITEEEIESSEQLDEPPPPPQPEPEAIKEMDIIDIVEDNIEVEAISFTSEDDASHAQVETYVAPTQVTVEEEDEDVIYDFYSLEKTPQFPGGEEALLKWIGDNMKYPPIAAEQGVSGRVSCQFVVEPDGSVSNVEVIRGFDPSCEREALRVLRMLPKFAPGEQRGKPVRVKYNIPVTFRLQ